VRRLGRRGTGGLTYRHNDDVAANDRLFPSLADPPAEKPALRFPDRMLDYPALRAAGAQVAHDVGAARRIAVWAEPRLETCVAIVGALLAGIAAVPINPKSGARELGHILGDSAPDLVVAPAGAALPPALGELPRVPIDLEAPGRDELPAEAPPETPALVVYTSGTTGPPKGAVLPRRAIASNLDALADAWAWTESDVVAHALPLFHVHGLVLGVLGPLRRGGTVRHLVRFSPEAVAAALHEDATVLFGVPTMYRRLADAAEAGPAVGDALGRARIIVSGSAPLPAAEHVRIERLTGQRVVERYGMTETLMNTAVRADGDRRAGYVGPPLAGVDLRLVDEDGNVIEAADGETIGEIHVRGPNLFLEYLNRPDATAEAMMADGWFRTGDLATIEGDGYLRIVGRRATDLIKSGGYKIGAGEIEAALREHPTVDDAAVTGAADPDLGERVVAWIVLRDGALASEEELVDHVAGLLAPHKRPRVVNFVDDLPRNELGKVQKTRLVSG
jgi:malonyl-CoA/methylmalonyl-CoA synthetase